MAVKLPSIRALRWTLWSLVAVVASIMFVRSQLQGASKRDLPVLGTVPEFDLTNQLSEPISRNALAGSVWIGDFIFTSCTTTCPMLTGRMKQVARALAEAYPGKTVPVKIVSFSVDPTNDTPERLRDYAAKWGAEPSQWLFLTGPTEGVQKVVTEGFKLGMTRVEREGTIDIVHANRFVLVDRQGRLRGYYDAEVAEDMKAIVADAVRLDANP